MKALTYRGVPYQTSDFSLPLCDYGVQGQYRGQPYAMKRSVGILYQTAMDLKYRGISY